MSDRAYYLPLNEDFSYGHPILIDLNEDGSANLSRLPDGLRETLESEGVPDPLRRSMIPPREGARFITALLYSTNPQLRCSENAELAN